MSSLLNLYLLGVYTQLLDSTWWDLIFRGTSCNAGSVFECRYSVDSAVMDWVFRWINNTCFASWNINSGFLLDCFESIQLSWFKTPAGVVTVSLPNSCIAGLETCLFHHCCLDLIQCINLACMSQALKSDNMENYFKSIRKLHLAPVHGLQWQAWTKQCMLLLILDYRARQQSDDLSRCCWYSFLVTALASRLSQRVKPGLMFTVAAESRETAGQHHGGTALLLHSAVWSQAAADVAVFVHNA